MKDSERKLVSELIKNSRRSDRELAKAIGVSQPTIGRMLKKLAKVGAIREYTMIPDFRQLGYTLMAFTFVKLKSALRPEQVEKARQVARESLTEAPKELVFLERGIGLGYNGLLITFHQDYSHYKEFRKWLTEFDFLEISDLQGFIVNLDGTAHYRPLTFQTLAKHLLTLAENDGRTL